MSVPNVRDVDVIYRETDRLYYEVARGCGLSETAFWSLVKIYEEGGRSTQAAIVSEYFYSRQTVNSAIKSLERKGLVTIAPDERDRRSKSVSLTDEGRKFCQLHIAPAVDAEQRAFESLTLEERTEFVRLVRAFTDAVDEELGQITRAREDDAS